MPAPSGAILHPLAGLSPGARFPNLTDVNRECPAEVGVS